MTIKLKGSTDGSVSFTAPADTSPTGTDITLTLPTTAGSANQFVKNSGTAGTLEYSSMVETSTGVGIGTTNPGGALEVQTAASERIIFDSAGASQRPRIQLVRDDGNDFKILNDLGIFKIHQNNDNIYRYSSDTHVFSSAGTERARLTSGGDLMVAKTSTSSATVGCEIRAIGYGGFTRSSGAPLLANRITNDGTLISLRQANTQEGVISVSGSTVSYVGGHLSRWSQLAGGAERTEILRGSVLSNLDEMCEWGDEDNEQLNRMKVSDVEGDVNVSGVFQSWDDDDDTYTNDFFCAMTGDFVIRIAQGTTVARGDLLMSAGDGTAKPQGDDIVRSKTIAKVTSTVVSETYADGSYCVPCVLMAC